jgi:hypothetical protein
MRRETSSIPVRLIEDEYIKDKKEKKKIDKDILKRRRMPIICQLLLTGISTRQ